MINFIIQHENLIEREIPDFVYVSQMTDETVIKNCIEFFNSEIEWDGMFDLEEAKRRLKYGDKFFVGYQNGKIFGYCWITRIEPKLFKVYNVFSRKTEQPRTYGATDMLFNVIKNHTHGTIIAEVDEWNIKSIRMFNKLGFKNA